MFKDSVLQGVKIHNENLKEGKVADFYFIYARTHPTAPGHQALTAFIVEKDIGVDPRNLQLARL